MIKDVGAKDLLLSKEYVKKPVDNICKLIKESDSKKIILSGGRGTGKSVVLCNLENQNDFIYMKFDPIQMFKLDDVFDEKFFNHYYEMIFMKKILLYIKQNYKILYDQYFKEFEDLYSDIVNYTTKYINNSRYETVSIDKYLSSTEISGEILQKLKKYVGINSFDLAIDRFDWTNGADELSQIILSKYFELFDKVVVTSDDESLDKNSKRKLKEKGYSFVNIDYGKKISFVKEIVLKRIEFYNENINRDHGEKYFPLSMMEKSIYENLLKKANGNISLIIDCLYETIETYNFKGSNFNPEHDFDIEMDIQIERVKTLRKMDAHKPKLYI
ncbi:MAG: hypothetical protein E7157_04530 [Lactobacillales bacterium]|nr:hypothetical protein [Lactobacillales bacterium]